jgi:hypothetical protein
VVGRDRDNHRTAAKPAPDLCFDEVADLTTAFADEARDDHVGFDASEHLAHQDRLADARSGDDCNALTNAHGEQGVDSTDTDIQRRGHSASTERVHALSGQWPGETAADWSAPVERLAVRVNHPSEQRVSALSSASVAVRFNPASGGHRCIGVERQDEAAILMKADHLATQKRVARVDPNGCPDWMGKAFGLEHRALMRNEPSDAARADTGKIHGTKR